MSSNSGNAGKKKNNYGEKIKRLGRYVYDKDSKEFQKGAWRWLTKDELRINLFALENRG